MNRTAHTSHPVNPHACPAAHAAAYPAVNAQAYYQAYPPPPNPYYQRPLPPSAPVTNRRHQRCGRRGRSSGHRVATMLAAILIILVGVGFMCYPKLTDFWYQFTQWRLAAQASGLTALVGDRTEDSEILGTGGGHTGVPLPGGTVALLEIPAIGFRAYVVEGTGRAALAQGPGHYPGTPLPGEPGNAAIAGHRTMYGHPFGDLDRLQPGDQILTATAQRRAAYRVVEILIVDPTHTEVAADAGDNRLTLTTCHPKGSAAKRLVVVAELTD